MNSKNVPEGEPKKSNAASGFSIVMAMCLIVFVGVIAVAVFFIAVRGAEETMVPDVRGKELTDALLELQSLARHSDGRPSARAALQKTRASRPGRHADKDVKRFFIIHNRTTPFFFTFMRT